MSKKTQFKQQLFSVQVLGKQRKTKEKCDYMFTCQWFGFFILLVRHFYSGLKKNQTFDNVPKSPWLLSDPGNKPEPSL